MHIEIPELAVEVMHKLEANGAEPVVVGGFVRDAVMRKLNHIGAPPKDVDLEVHGIDTEPLIAILRTFGKVHSVGASFGVLNLAFPNGEHYDVSLPRLDSKMRPGHRGIDTEFVPGLALREAAKRRDFTINTLMARSDGQVIDLFNAEADIRSGVLRAVSDRFGDDPLRVLRGMQFAARFSMCMDSATVAMSRELLSEFLGEADTLSAERKWEEFSKLARAPFPAAGLRLLVDTGWIAGFPELDALRGTVQDAAWHPEGDAWVHTLQAATQAARIARLEGLDGEQTETLVVAAILHDIGKPSTTTRRDGRILSQGHAEVGAEMARAFLQRMRAPDGVTERVRLLVHHHMAHATFGGSRPKYRQVDGRWVQESKPTGTAVRRLAGKLAASPRPEQRVSIRTLALLAEADASGRHPAPPRSPMAEWVKIAEHVHVADKRAEPILQGRHLLAAPFNMTAGPAFKPILKRAFEAQLDGEFDDEPGAIAWAGRELIPAG